MRGYQDFLAPETQTPTERKSSRRAESASPRASGDGYQIFSASTGEQAIEIVKKELAAGRQIAAGFFDVKLGPGIDGLTTIQRLKKLDPDIRCVVVTAYHDRSVDEIGQLFGDEFKDHWDYLNKPFTQGEIVQKARQMVAAWNREKRLELLQGELVKSERLAAVGQVARGVGHEFGNILQRILGKADMALDEKDPAKQKEHIEVILSASERAGVIVRNLQSFSKPESKFTHAKLSEPLEQALSLINHEFVKFKVKLERKISNVSETRLDVGGLAQVFLNIMINATHAMTAGGTLTVTLSEEDGGVSCRIRDTGTGIPKDVLPRIFDYAFSTKGDSGSGLGLAISKEIVESHGGKIVVTTEMGKGTEFRVWIPKQT